MAPYFWRQGCFRYTVLSIFVLITSTTESTSPASQESFISLEKIRTNQRVARSPDEETFQSRIPKKIEDLENTEEDLNETQYNSQQSNSGEFTEENNSDNRNDNPQLIKDQDKINKQNESKKYNPSDFKNKVSVETKISASNESASDKQKLLSYNPNPVIKYNNSFKKDIKLNASASDYNFKAENSNIKVPSKFILEKKNNTKVAKLNETSLMNDQPAASNSNVIHNTTDISEEEALDGPSQNSTSFGEDSNHTTSSSFGPTLPTDDIDIALVSGVTLVTAVLLGLVAGGGFVYYRHRMWNKPQTLSDKCSNADSSGYIDDSTLRENSEEMYSLDNDSFLNSLEAMTIQNYWTDNVKHTKL